MKGCRYPMTGACCAVVSLLIIQGLSASKMIWPPRLHLIEDTPCVFCHMLAQGKLPPFFLKKNIAWCLPFRCSFIVALHCDKFVR